MPHTIKCDQLQLDDFVVQLMSVVTHIENNLVKSTI